MTSVAFSPDGRFALSGSWDKSLRLWELATGRCVRSCEGHTDFVRSVAFSPDGELVLSGSIDRALRLWQIDSGECLRILRSWDAMQPSYGQGFGQLGTVRTAPALNFRVLANDVPFAAIEITGDRLTLRFKTQPRPALFVCADAVVSNEPVASH